MIIIGTNILNQTHGNGNDMWCSSETTGNACIVADVLPKFITRNMQGGTLERSQSNGLSPSARIVMKPNIIRLIKAAHNMGFSTMLAKEYILIV